MIPVKLSLRNFMCYRDKVPPLQFTGIRTATISGNNGNGKSALIDAMTWALWGKARAKSDDDLIYLGETEMEVEFDFEVSGQTYRIIRKHARPKRQRASGKTILSFQIAHNSGFRSLGSSIAHTQQVINQVLHMDYDTFVNSALLLQGRADKFTVAPPAKRKQVLADILELTFYDKLEETAKEKARLEEMAKTQLENTIQDIRDELNQKPVYEAELTRAQAKLSRIEADKKEQESGLSELRRKREYLANIQQQLARMETRSADVARALEQWDEQINQHHIQIRQYEGLIAQRTTIEANYAQLVETRQQNEELNQKLRLVNTLNEHQHQLAMAVERASQDLHRERALVESKIKELEAEAEKLPRFKEEWQQIAIRLQQLAGEEAVLRQQGQQSQELRTNIFTREAEIARLEQGITEIVEKLELLHTQHDTRCPLCETELGTDKLNLITGKYTADKNQKAASIKSKQNTLGRQKKELGGLESELTRLESSLNRDKASAQGKASVIQQAIEEADKAASQLKETKKQLAKTEERLARKEFATGEQKELNRLEAEIARLNYDPGQHKEMGQRLSRLEPYETPKQKLEEADRRIYQEKEAALRAEKASQELRQSLETDRQERERLTTELGLLPRIKSELDSAEAAHQITSTQERQAQETVGSIKGKLARCSELETKAQEKTKLLARAASEEKIYRDLAQAFGKKGVQALLIEMALPEIEIAANKLLGRMTDNRMHVKIETQRETRKGDSLETLDIKIADDLGMRNYEMYSGGEAFRINFAVRVALSELLARRANAPLPTLIIDEGFGTQDSSGLEKLKEAINSIQDDFKMIIVITHVEELRDAFPARIDVIKTAEGSTLKVS